MSMSLPVLAAANPAKSRRNGLTWWMLALIALLAIAVYANSLKNGYAYDDVGIIQNTAHVLDLDWTRIWTDNYWPKVEGVQPDALYRPLTLWSYLANQAMGPAVDQFCSHFSPVASGGGFAWQFHLVNVLLHALVTVLVALLAWRILGNRAVAIVAGILFAVHPLHTEVVANIVGRAELLATAWSLLALLLFLPARPLAQAGSPVIARRLPLVQLAILAACTLLGLVIGAKIGVDPMIGAFRGFTAGVATGLLGAFLAWWALRNSALAAGLRPWWHGGLVAIAFGAALLSKETPASLAFGLVLIDAWRFSRWRRGSRPAWYAWFSSQAVRYYSPVALVTGLYCLARLNAGNLMSRAAIVHPVVNPLVSATPLQRIVGPFMLLAKYLLLTVWPVHLSADYSAPSLMPTANLFWGSGFQPPAIFGMLVCVLAVILSIRLWKRRPQFLLLAGMAFISYMLVANVVRIGTIFGERLFYWPSVFALIVIAWAGAGALRRVRLAYSEQVSPAFLRTICAGIFVLAIGAMGVRTWIRNTDWSGNTALAISTARDNPMSGKACSWAGSVLVNTDNPEYQSFGKSLIERSIELTPDYVSARWEIAKYYGIRGEMGPSAVCIAQAARQDPGTDMTRRAIPALVDQLRTTATEKYMPYIENYQKDHPADEGSYLALAFAYHAQGKWDKAEEMCYKALNTAIPKRADKADGYHEAGAELAAIRFDRGDVEQAVITMRKYTLNIRNSVDGHCTFAAMLLALDPKKNPDAVKEAQFNLDLADAITPNNPRVRTVRGQLERFKIAVARGQPIPADIPVPRVAIAAEPKSEVLP